MMMRHALLVACCLACTSLATPTGIALPVRPFDFASRYIADPEGFHRRDDLRFLRRSYDAAPAPAETNTADRPAEPDIADLGLPLPPAIKPIVDRELAAPVPREEFCTILVAAAQTNDLPVGFFANLIWQESRFDHKAVSPVGAQGVAQFMPGTAEEVGLDNPFDARDALRASARLLRSLHERFGNLGLAAAAYNAGPGRVASWLTRRVGLPRETRDYIQTITGQPADRWDDEKPQAAIFKVPPRVPCHRVAAFAQVERHERAIMEAVKARLDAEAAEKRRLADLEASAAERKRKKKGAHRIVRKKQPEQTAAVTEKNDTANDRPDDGKTVKSGKATESSNAKSSDTAKSGEATSKAAKVAKAAPAKPSKTGQTAKVEETPVRSRKPLSAAKANQSVEQPQPRSPRASRVAK